MATLFPRLTKADFFNTPVYESLQSRLASLSPDAQPKWGIMNVNQMLHHLNLAIGVGLGDVQLNPEHTLITRIMVKWVVLDLIGGFPVNSKTATDLLVTDNYVFETEKEKLSSILHRAHTAAPDFKWHEHPYFGTLTRKGWGRLIAIHCNHHFTQFGV